MIFNRTHARPPAFLSRKSRECALCHVRWELSEENPAYEVAWPVYSGIEQAPVEPGKYLVTVLCAECANGLRACLADDAQRVIGTLVDAVARFKEWYLSEDDTKPDLEEVARPLLAALD